MPRIALLVAVSVLLIETLFSQQSPKLVGLDTLLANPQPYVGQTIALYGVVDKTDAATGFKLTEAQNFGAGAKTQPSQLQATWMKDARLVSVQNGEETIVIGQVQIRNNASIFQIANFITDKDAIRRFIRRSERRPRPGDNLGHDAEPSKSLSD